MYYYLQKLKELLSQLAKSLNQSSPSETKMNRDKFLKICLDALDTDVTPKDEVPDDVACAETISVLLKKVFSDFQIFTSTKDLDFKLFLDKRFKKVTSPERGDIVSSPSLTNKDGTIKTHGHIGVLITSEKIASNTSKDGIFRGNYTLESWIEEMKERKLNTYYYRIIS